MTTPKKEDQEKKNQIRSNVSSGAGAKRKGKQSKGNAPTPPFFSTSARMSSPSRLFQVARSSAEGAVPMRPGWETPAKRKMY